MTHKLLTIYFTFICCLSVQAIRKVDSAPFSTHTWIGGTSWNPSQIGLERHFELTIFNHSTIDQTVQVNFVSSTTPVCATVTPIVRNRTGTYDGTTAPLSPSFSSSLNPGSQVISANSSGRFSITFQYTFAGTHWCHISDSVVAQIQVNEDQGQVSAAFISHLTGGQAVDSNPWGVVHNHDDSLLILAGRKF